MYAMTMRRSVENYALPSNIVAATGAVYVFAASAIAQILAAALVFAIEQKQPKEASEIIRSVLDIGVPSHL
jgi:hypothetical protein